MADSDGSDAPATVHRDLEIPTDDGTVAATRHEPTAGDAPRPVILVYTPYHKDDRSDSEGDPLVRFFAERDYEVVVADLVGTGASEGTADAPFVAAEGRSGAAVVEWLAAQPWTTGAVGVVGKSYPGTTALEIAAERPDGLAAIVPVHAPVRPYDSYYDGGALALLRTAGLWAPNFESLAVQPPARRDRAGAWAVRWDERLASLPDRDPFPFQYLDHPTKDDYWAATDVPVDRIEVPTLAFGGYRDPFAADAIDLLDRVDAPARLVLGPWRHTLPDRGTEVAIDFLGEVERWFATFLRDEATDVLDEPRIRYWTSLGDDGATPGTRGVWRGRASWPTAATSTPTVDLAMTDDGLRMADRVEDDGLQESWAPDWGVGAASIGFEIPNGRPLDSGPDDRRSVTVETDPLEAPAEFVGRGTAEVTIVPETTDPLVVVRIVDVSPSGDARLVTHGVRRASLPRPIDPLGATADEPVPLEPGEAVAVTVPLRPHAHVFGAGHRVRVAISGASFPYVLPPADAGGFDVVSTADAPSIVHLPGTTLDPDADVEATVAFDPPREAYRADPAPLSWTTTVDHRDGRVAVSLDQSYSSSLPAATFEYEMHVEATTDRDDHASARVERTTETVVDDGSERVRTTVWSAVTGAMAHVTYDVAVDGTTIAAERKRWTRSRG